MQSVLPGGIRRRVGLEKVNTRLKKTARRALWTMPSCRRHRSCAARNMEERCGTDACGVRDQRATGMIGSLQRAVISPPLLPEMLIFWELV